MALLRRTRHNLFLKEPYGNPGPGGRSRLHSFKTRRRPWGAGAPPRQHAFWGKGG